MDNAIIFDIVTGAVLVAGFVVGATRGLFKSLMGLVVVVAALLGAAFLANLITAPVTEKISPLIEEKMVAAFSDDLDQLGTTRAGGGDETDVLTEFLEQHGVTEDSQIRKLLSGLSDIVSGAAAGTKEKTVDTYRSVITESVRSLVSTIVHGVIFFLTFLVLLVVLKLLVKLIDKALELPGISTLNAIGGGVVGLAEAVLLIFLALWLARRFSGSEWLAGGAEGTYLLSFFLNNTPKSLLNILMNGR